jgi:hypothetical protein
VVVLTRSEGSSPFSRTHKTGADDGLRRLFHLNPPQYRNTLMPKYRNPAHAVNPGKLGCKPGKTCVEALFCSRFAKISARTFR